MDDGWVTGGVMIVVGVSVKKKSIHRDGLKIQLLVFKFLIDEKEGKKLYVVEIHKRQFFVFVVDEIEKKIYIKQVKYGDFVFCECFESGKKYIYI